MGEWKTVKIGDLGKVFDGPHATPKTVSEGPIFLGIGALQNGRINLRETRHVTMDDFEKWTRRIRPRAGDIVFSYETRLGQAAIIPEGMMCCLGRRMGLVRVDQTKILPRFFLYNYISPQFQEFLRSRTVHGATVDRLLLTEFPDFLFPCPSLHEQKAIASLLGALDDKIELNRRTNETLEAMARSIFKDWFVDFGPTRAKAEGRSPYLAPELWDLFPDALDADKPVGWPEIPLKQLGTVITGKTPNTKKPEFFGSEMPFLKIPDMHGRIYVLRTSTELSDEGARSQRKKTVPAGSVSVSCIATPGLVTFNHRDIQTNQQINSIIPTDPKQSHFVFWSCRQLASAVMLGGSGGSVFHNMNKTLFENLRLVYPGEKIAHTYSKTVSLMHDRILSNEYENVTLAQTRDLLLPKLMSGEIRLREAEKAVEAVA